MALFKIQIIFLSLAIKNHAKSTVLLLRGKESNGRKGMLTNASFPDAKNQGDFIGIRKL